MENIYFFQWISDLGGADTRLKELIQLFAETGRYNLFCIPNDVNRLQEKGNVDFLNRHGVKTLAWEELPIKTEGYAIAFCNFRLFQDRWRLEKIKNIGLKFIWSNDMMWSSKEEGAAIEQKLVSSVIFTSDFHKKQLLKVNPSIAKLKSFIIPNYFHLDNYIKAPKKESLKNKFVVGKLSRADEMKFGENFPLFYDKMPIENPKFRIMGWQQKLIDKFKWFEFNKERWELLTENQETILGFLSQLDLYVFNAHHDYIENQSRAMIEAQLLGVPVIAPNYGNFPNMVWHGRNGFIYNNIEECYKYVNLLQKDKDLYNEISNNSFDLSKTVWTNSNAQLKYWESIFQSI
jgi:glycosyltransferase involved in cell wall biosynthesis